MRARIGLLTCALASCVAAQRATAQVGGEVGARPVARPIAASRTIGNGERLNGAAPSAPWWSPVASLVLPGAGQVAMRQPRAAAYLGVEAYEWIQLLESTRNVRHLRGEYRRIAREVARSGVAGPRPDGNWAYYEAMEEYGASGRFSLGTTADLVPETDEATFNGALWRKARSLYWVNADVPPPKTDPSYQSAVAFYLDQAVRDDFAWTWRNAQISQAEYASTIARYNTATRDVRNALGIILANHLVSAIDAFSTVRIRHARGTRGEQRFEVIVPLEAFGRRRPADRP